VAMVVVGCGAMPPSMKMLVMISAIVVADGAALRKTIRVF